MSIKQIIKRILKRILRLDPVPAKDNCRHAKVIPNADLLPLVAEYISKGHTVTLPLKGNSMRPFLQHQRDIALLDAPSHIKVSDPVLAEIKPGYYVLHRIIDIDGDAVTLLGDGNLQPEHCTLNDIKALAVAFYRKGRTTPDYITSYKWKIYSTVWMHLRPIRRYLLPLHHAIFRSLKTLN